MTQTHRATRRRHRRAPYRSLPHMLFNLGNLQVVFEHEAGAAYGDFGLRESDGEELDEDFLHQKSDTNLLAMSDSDSPDCEIFDIRNYF